jgi:hypothetical protein
MKPRLEVLSLMGLIGAVRDARTQQRTRVTSGPATGLRSPRPKGRKPRIGASHPGSHHHARYLKREKNRRRARLAAAR